jgi:gas vesicle protein
MSESTHRGQAPALFLAFLAGAVSGAVVALLTAPRSGRETRDRLRQMAQDATGRAGRVPSGLHDAYARAARAAQQAFLESFEAQSHETSVPPGAGRH